MLASVPETFEVVLVVILACCWLLWTSRLLLLATAALRENTCRWTSRVLLSEEDLVFLRRLHVRF